MKLNDYVVAIFDCDGVILDSNAMKVEAFRWALRSYPQEQVSRLIDYHLENGGVSRHEKVRYFLDEILGDSDDSAFERAISDFASYCEERLCRCPLIPGIRPFLEQLTCRKFVVTGGNQTEVLNALEYHGLLGQFCEVLGSPPSKHFHMERLQKAGYFECRGVYFGDAKLDFELARRHDLDFVFVSGASDWHEGARICEAHKAVVWQDFTAMNSLE